MPARVVLAMSGGVDSSASAVLLKEQGYDVVGLFMRTGAHTDETDNRRDNKKGCCSAIDAGDARRVADRLDIPFYALDFEREFDRIIDYFADEYLAGRTPNPCVVCNTWLKFGQLWAFGQQLDADFIATGHYARILPGPNGEPELHKAVDPDKDQSYVLYGIRREVLAAPAVPRRRVAQGRGAGPGAGARAGGVADKPDSVEICFVPDGDHAGLIRKRRPELGDGRGRRGHGGNGPGRARRHRAVHHRPAQGAGHRGRPEAVRAGDRARDRGRSSSATARTCWRPGWSRSG